jgi:hypothetical protein
MGLNMSTAKHVAITGATVLVFMLVFNSIAKRVPAVAQIKAKVDGGV